ncbi:diphthamide synthesis protein [Candidatus Woesearchaeota archaeon]|nr:diphthamide synthesis protein [Candidatus Woesearchaeota archaeon]
MYDLELDKLIEKIKSTNAKLVCLQLPDGLKPKADIIQKEIKKKTDAEVVIWLSSCFGSCDIPVEIKKLGVDLLVQWGHSEWL